MASTADRINASQNSDLIARLVIVANDEGIPNPHAWVTENIVSIVSANIGDTTVSDVFAYAVATYEPTPRPGQNLAAVTDPQLLAAVQAVTV